MVTFLFCSQGKLIQDLPRTELKRSINHTIFACTSMICTHLLKSELSFTLQSSQTPTSEEKDTGQCDYGSKFTMGWPFCLALLLFIAPQSFHTVYTLYSNL